MPQKRGLVTRQRIAGIQDLTTGFDRAANQRLVLDRLATSCAKPIGTGQSSARHGHLAEQNGKWRNVRVPFKQRGDIAKTLLRVLVNLPDLVANPAVVVVDDDIAAVHQMCRHLVNPVDTSAQRINATAGQALIERIHRNIIDVYQQPATTTRGHLGLAESTRAD